MGTAQDIHTVTYKLAVAGSRCKVNGFAKAFVMCWNPVGIYLIRQAFCPTLLRKPMKKLLTLLALGLSMAMGVAHAADAAAPAAAPTKQQSKMKTCNLEAKGKLGDERKMFMKECLSAKPAAAAAAAGTPQQTKMKTCNMEAKGKLGAERKKFMKECLSA
jgi:hypothetical protein